MTTLKIKDFIQNYLELCGIFFCVKIYLKAFEIFLIYCNIQMCVYIYIYQDSQTKFISQLSIQIFINILI